MIRFGLVAALLTSLPAGAATVAHVVAWGDTASPLIKQFPDSLSATRWVQACGNRSLAYKSNRRMTWWGSNAIDPVSSPTQRMALRSVACSEELSLGLTDSGTVVKWGPAPSLGDPTPPAGLKDVASLSAGTFHAVALKKDGSVVAWGGNLDSVATKTNGRTGILALSAGGAQTVLLRTDSTVEVVGGKLTMVDKVPSDLKNVLAVASGGRHVLALKLDGKVVGWGDTAGTGWKVPADLDSVTAIAAGGFHSLALRRDGSVVCWGRNDKGQCDIPSTVKDVVAIAAGTDHSLALRRDGKVVAWGSDAQGQCTVPLKTIPVESIHMGRNAAAAILADGRLVAWGSLPLAPIPVLPAGRRWKSVSFGNTPHALGIDDQGKPYAWGSATSGVSTMPESISVASQVEATRAVSVVLVPGHRLITWGDDNDGLVTGPSTAQDVVQFDASEYRIIALRADSTIRMWGKQVFSTDSAPDSAKRAIAVAAGDQSFLALLPNRRVHAWNPRAGMADWHRAPAGLDSVVAISAGSVHALALRSNGKVVCWGDTTLGRCAVPSDLPPASAALAGEAVSLALVPVEQIPDPTTGVSDRSHRTETVRFRSEARGLRLLSGSALVSVFSVAGRPVVAPTMLQAGGVVGGDLPRGVYLVRIEGGKHSYRWVRSER